MSRIVDDSKSDSAKEYSRIIDMMIGVMIKATEKIDQLGEACNLYKQALDERAECCGCGQGADKEAIADLLASGEASPVAGGARDARTGTDAPTTGLG